MLSYPKDSRFDWCATFSSTVFAHLIDLVEADIWARRGPRGSNHVSSSSLYRSFLNQVFSALYQAYFTESPRLRSMVSIGLPLTHSAYAGSSNSPYTVRIAQRVEESLRACHLVKTIPGHPTHGITRVQPAEKLIQAFEEIGFKWLEQKPKPMEYLVTGSRSEKIWDYSKGKSNKRKVPVFVEQNEEYNAIRRDVFTINSEIVRHRFTLNLTDDQLDRLLWYMHDKEKYPVTKKHPSTPIQMPFNLFHVQLRRILNGPLLDGGGRFYGGWWQQIPSRFRRYITIDGAYTREIDFSALHPHICYASIGMKMPHGDFYDLGFNWQGSDHDIEQRKIVKKYINSVINSKGHVKLSDHEQEIIGLNTRTLKKRLLEIHSPIQEFFQSGFGLTAQRIDSDIANAIMLDFASMGEVALPVHDSFIVKASMSSYLKNLMKKEFFTRFKLDINVQEDFIGFEENFDLSEEEINEKAKWIDKNPSKGVIDGREIDVKKLLKPLSWIQSFGAEMD